MSKIYINSENQLVEIDSKVTGVGLSADAVKALTQEVIQTKGVTREVVDSIVDSKLENFETLPSGGTIGQILTKIDADLAEWADAPVALPQGGTTGQVLVKSSDQDGEAEWVDNKSGVDKDELSQLITEEIGKMDIGSNNALNLKILVPSNTTFTSKPHCHVVCDELPNPVGAKANLTLPSPFGNSICFTQALVKINDVWSTVGTQYYSGTAPRDTGIITSCPGDGNIYLVTPQAISASFGVAPQYATAVTSAEVVILVLAPTTEVAKGDIGKTYIPHIDDGGNLIWTLTRLGDEDTAPEILPFKLNTFTIGEVVHSTTATTSVVNSGTRENPVLDFIIQDGASVLTHGGVDYNNRITLPLETISAASPFQYQTTIPVPGLLACSVTTTTSAVGSYIQCNVNDVTVHRTHVNTGSNIFTLPVDAGDVVNMTWNVANNAYSIYLFPYKQDSELIGQLSNFSIGKVEHGTTLDTSITNSGTTTAPVLNFKIKDGASVLTQGVPNYNAEYPLEFSNEVVDSTYYYYVTAPENGEILYSITIGTATVSSYLQVEEYNEELSTWNKFNTHPMRSGNNIHRICAHVGHQYRFFSNVSITSAQFSMLPYKNDETLLSQISSLSIGNCTTNDNNRFEVTNTGTAKNPVLNFSLPKVIKYEGTNIPPNSLGENGDFYFQYFE